MSKRIALVAALLALVSMPVYAEKIVIEHFEHKACIVEDGDILPDYALLGTKSSPLRNDQFVDCRDIVNRALVFCEHAIEPPYSWQEVDHPECSEFFESQVSACQFHYINQREKCGILERAYRQEKLKEGKEARRIQEETQRIREETARIRAETKRTRERIERTRERTERTRERTERTRERTERIRENTRAKRENKKATLYDATKDSIAHMQQMIRDKQREEEQERIGRQRASASVLKGILGALQSEFGSGSVPSYGSSGGSNNCERLGNAFSRDYGSYSGSGMCQIYQHQLRVLKSHRNSLVNAGCVSASEWDSTIRQTRAGVNAAC